MRKLRNNERKIRNHDLEDDLDEIKMYFKYLYDVTVYKVILGILVCTIMSF